MLYIRRQPVPGMIHITLFISGLLVAVILVGCGQAQAPDEEAIRTIEEALQRPRPENPQAGSSPASSVSPTPPDIQATITAAVEATRVASPTPTHIPIPTLEPTATPTQVPTPTPKVGDELYNAEAENFEKWSLTPDWKALRGILLNDGTWPGNRFAPSFAPLEPQTLVDYAVKAEIRVIQETGSSFGILVRAGEKNEGYIVGVGRGWDRTTGISYLDVWWGTNDLKGRIAEGRPFDPGTDWHTYAWRCKEIRSNCS
jgi:hypothetical protein